MCSSVAVSALSSMAPGDRRTTSSARKRCEHRRIPPVRLDEQIAVALEVGRQAPDRLLEAQLLGQLVVHGGVARPDPHRRRGRARLGCGRGAPVATQRSTVSSVKNVCSTTMSNTRPASASEFGPNATKPIGMSSSNDESRCSTGNFPAGPSWPKTTSPFQQPPQEPDEVLDLRGRDPGDAVGVEQRRDAASEPEREPPAGEPVHRRGVRRGDDRVAGVVVRRRGRDPERRRHGADRTRQRERLLDVEALGDERAAEPERLARGAPRRSARPATWARRRARRSRARSSMLRRRTWPRP